MEEDWMTLAEIAMEPGDVPSGDTLGFLWITMWASSEENFYGKLTNYLAEYQLEAARSREYKCG